MTLSCYGSRVSRTARVARKTRETDITVELDLDGSGKADIVTPLPFLSHMVEQIARHGLIYLSVRAAGDVDIDGHHTTENLGIVLGETVRQALGDKGGIVRYGWATLPMDEALVTAAIDLSGRPFFVWKVPLPKAKLGTWDVELAPIFFEAFARAAMCNLHVRLHEGENFITSSRSRSRRSRRRWRKRPDSTRASPASPPPRVRFRRHSSIELWPAIDLLRGKAVRLHQGDYDKVTIYHDDPRALAASWRGVARHLHVWSISRGPVPGARSEGDRLIRDIIAAFGPAIEVGGGVRDRAAIESYLALGADRVVLGTAPSATPRWCAKRRSPTPAASCWRSTPKTGSWPLMVGSRSRSTRSRSSASSPISHCSGALHRHLARRHARRA